MPTGANGWRCLWRRIIPFLGIVVFLAVAPDASAQTLEEIDTPSFKADAALPFWKALSDSRCRAIPWQPDYSSVSAFSVSLHPLTADLQDRIGRFPRTRGGEVLTSQQVFENDRYRVDLVQVSTPLKYVDAFGYLATPKDSIGGDLINAPAVVMIHGAGLLPQQAFAMRFANEGGAVLLRDSTAFIGMGVDFVEAGYTVFAPWLSDNVDMAPNFPWLNLDRWGNMQRQKTGAGGPYTFIAAQVSGVMSYLSRRRGADPRIVLAGWGEGSQIATVVAAQDPRVNAVVRIAPPIDWKAFRRTAVGVRVGAGFSQMDCALGDVELGAMIAPRPLLYAYSSAGATAQARARFVSPAVLADLKRIYALFGARERIAVRSDTAISTGPANRVSMMTVLWLDSLFGRTFSRDQFSGIAPIPPPTDYPRDWIEEHESHVAQYITTLGSCRPSSFRASFTSAAAYSGSVREYLPRLAQESGFVLPRRNVAIDTLDRRIVLDTTTYVLEFLRLRIRGSSMEILGLMATPKGRTGLMPAVLSVDGNSNLKEVFGLPPVPVAPYLNAYAERLLAQGTIVFSVYLPVWFEEGASAALHARDPAGMSGWGLLVPYYSAATDVLWSKPQVDRQRFAIKGVSFAGHAALLMAAVDDRFSALAFTNIVVNHDFLFSAGGGGVVQTWYGDLCSSMAQQFRLIAPRRFVWESGEDPEMLNANMDVVEDVRAIYNALGLWNQFEFVRHGGGHETKMDFSIFGPN